MKWGELESDDDGKAKKKEYTQCNVSAPVCLLNDQKTEKDRWHWLKAKWEKKHFYRILRILLLFIRVLHILEMIDDTFCISIYMILPFVILS